MSPASLGTPFKLCRSDASDLTIQLPHQTWIMVRLSWCHSHLCSLCSNIMLVMDKLCAAQRSSKHDLGSCQAHTLKLQFELQLKFGRKGRLSWPRWIGSNCKKEKINWLKMSASHRQRDSVVYVALTDKYNIGVIFIKSATMYFTN